MKLFTTRTIILNTLIVGANSSGVPIAEDCLSSSQLNSVVHFIDTVKDNWTNDSNAIEHDSDKVEAANNLLDGMNSLMKFLASDHDATVCATDTNHKQLSNSLLDSLSELVDHLQTFTYSPQFGKKSEGSNVKQDLAYNDDETQQNDAHGSGDLIDARRRGHGRQQPTNPTGSTPYAPAYVAPPEYVPYSPGYAAPPGYAPAPAGYQPAYPGGYAPSPARYPPVGYGQQPEPVPGTYYPQNTPDTGGYKYQGGTEENSKSSQVQAHTRSKEHRIRL